MSLFVDTSVWSLAFRRDQPTASAEVETLIRALESGETLFTTGLVLQELLQGFTGAKGRDQIVERFSALPLIVPDRADHIRAAELRNHCRRKGVQIGTIHALLAQVCLRHDLTMLTADKDFSRVLFSGSHDASAISVQNRKVDAAAIADRILDAAVTRGLAKREDLVIVWKSDPIPESPTVWRKDLSPDLKKRIQAAFLEVKNIPWSDQGELNGFHPTNDAAYNVIRDAAKALNLDLKKMK